MKTNGVDIQSSPAESLVSWRTAEGIELKGRLLRISPHSAAFELHHSHLILRHSEVLAPFLVTVNGVSAYSGRAVVTHVVNTGQALVCEATLDSALDPGVFTAMGDAGQLAERFRSFMRQWQETYRILTPYKVAVADLQSYLIQLRQWLEQLELSIRATPAGDRLKLEHDTLEKLGKEVLPIIDQFFETFETVTPSIEPGMLPAHRAYLQQQLHPLTLCSPFAYRTFAKPLGYAGDYEMVNMMTRNPLEGASVFAKLINLWFVEQPPARAHRNRIDRLQRVLSDETARTAAFSRQARILSLGSGPAVEVQRFLAETPWSDRARFDLLDFNDETLAQARNQLESVKGRFGRSTGFTFINKAVHQLLKQSVKSVERPPDQQYDLIYCAGLFDYLADGMCQKLMTLFYSWVAPGGLLLVTNVDPSNPLRHGMEQLLDWHLIYRDGAALRALKPAQIALEDALVSSDMTGVNLFLEIRKGGHA